MTTTFTFGKHKNEQVETVPESYLLWLLSHAKVLATINRWIVKKVQMFLEKGKQVKIEKTIRPYSWRKEDLKVGRIVDGEFVPERGIWSVQKDARLNVKRAYDGKGAQQDVTYTFDVPANYPLFIVHVHCVDKPGRPEEYETLYSPAI